MNKLVWDVFIEESMGDSKAQDYTDRIKEYSEDMSYITYKNVIQQIHDGVHYTDIKFDDVIPNMLKIENKWEGGRKV
jgi:hypothetical protein